MSSLIIVKDLNTPAGYVKLQLVRNGVPCTFIHWDSVCDYVRKGCFTTDRFERIILFDFANADDVFSRSKNKAALKSETKSI